MEGRKRMSRKRHAVEMLGGKFTALLVHLKHITLAVQGTVDDIF